MKKGEQIILEVILIFSTVLVFRSLWEMMDKVSLFNETYVHLILLLIGSLLSVAALYKLTRS